MKSFKQFFNQSLTLLGKVCNMNVDTNSFELELRSGDKITTYIGEQTYFKVLGNLDGLNYDRVEEPKVTPNNPVQYKMYKYIREGDKVYVQGLYLTHDNKEHFDAHQVILMHYLPSSFIFEEKTHWWLTQVRAMADAWLENLFGDIRDYEHTDFAKLYRTNLNIYGALTDDKTQEMATLSRLIYGLSSAYLLLGDPRMLSAAKAGVEFQTSAFKSGGSEGTFDFWAHARKPLQGGATTIYQSLNKDDYGSIPLYEQIYALAGLTQYFRITNDLVVLNDIQHTVNMFNLFYLDSKESKQKGFPGKEGYFSHIDPITRRPDSDALSNLKSRKNWNSLGDHIPAYLINLILALDPLPKDAGDEIDKLLKTCNEMLDLTTRLIIEKFPDDLSPYVNERFFADWEPDHEWGWQKNRAIVGHNLKIAWNLTRVANYYLSKGRNQDAQSAFKVAEKLGQAMEKAGLDLVRGGCFDAVERDPQDGRFVQCVWGNHKDFWQQEQGILAYLILYGYTGNELYKDLYRDICAWWNAFHLDHENKSIYFRVTDNGEPYIKGRGVAGYDIAGYHAFELNYLAHIYIRTYINAKPEHEVHFCLYFLPDENSDIYSINVLPDFMKPDTIEIVGIEVDGVPRDYIADKNFQIPIEPDERGKQFVIQFRNCCLK